MWHSIKKLHRVLGHPSSATLVRLFQRFQASDMAIDAAKSLRCSICDETVPPVSHPVVGIRRAEVFNELVFIDAFEVKLMLVAPS